MRRRSPSSTASKGRRNQRAIFNQALDQLGTAADAVVFVDDNAAAADLGVSAVQIVRGESDGQVVAGEGPPHEQDRRRVRHDLLDRSPEPVLQVGEQQRAGRGTG